MKATIATLNKTGYSRLSIPSSIRHPTKSKNRRGGLYAMLAGANGTALHLVRDALELWQLETRGWVFALAGHKREMERVKGESIVGAENGHNLYEICGRVNCPGRQPIGRPIETPP